MVCRAILSQIAHFNRRYQFDNVKIFSMVEAYINSQYIIYRGYDSYCVAFKTKKIGRAIRIGMLKQEINKGLAISMLEIVLINTWYRCVLVSLDSGSLYDLFHLLNLFSFR